MIEFENESESEFWDSVFVAAIMSPNLALLGHSVADVCDAAVETRRRRHAKLDGQGKQ